MPTTSHHPTAQTVTTETHPIDQGWLHAELELTSADPLPQNEAEGLICFVFGGPHRHPQNYDIALCAQNGKTLNGCIRPKLWGLFKS